ncbi:MAG: DNA-3-methyladenine glycosylase [Actinomycetaceae bacterium]
MTAPDDVRAVREFLARPAPEVAPELLGAVVVVRSTEGEVGVRLTEVEAYLGPDDPGSHARSGVPTARTAPMFGPAGHVYVYFTYGLHTCLNLVCGTDGQATGALLRGGEVVRGHDLARARRREPSTDAALARGPGNLGQALGLTLEDSGLALDPAGRIWLELGAARAGHRSGPRVGVSGPGGDGEQFPWRFWVPGGVGVSAYRPGGARSRGRSRTGGGSGAGSSGQGSSAVGGGGER